MKIYVAHTYGVTGTWREDDDPERFGAHVGEPRLGDIVLRRHTTLNGAQETCEQAFTAELDDGKTAPWSRDVVVWHPPRDGAPGDLSLWSLLPSAAPASNDPNRTPYPQMRETTYWVETLDVIEDGVLHEPSGVPLVAVPGKAPEVSHGEPGKTA